ncbi:MAG TPA: class I SAM-dependent methyltransferase [Ferruginibacter sp.]|nr:class I SAM-dependent methyltransferase [Ferruginibacter sp.]
MKLFSYIRYFFYIANNWNISIAWYIIKQEVKGEKKYGIHTTGVDELKQLEEKGIDITHTTIYMPSSYELLEDLFSQLNASPTKSLTHFLDIGCGKGRALCVAAHQGIPKVTGIDLAKELSDAAKENLAATKQKIPSLNYNVINNDAFYFEIPADVDCIFLFNPFDEIIMSGVVNNIVKSLKKHRRKIIVLYINPLQKQLFSRVGFKETWHTKKMEYLEAVIMEN